MSEDADLFDTLGIDGDDAFAFMDRFASRFEIEASNYRWYFHHGEEGHNIGGLFFRPPYRRVERIAITPRVLVEAIQTKRWPIEYPEHCLPGVRWDIRFNQVFVLMTVAALALWLWQHFVH